MKSKLLAELIDSILSMKTGSDSDETTSELPKIGDECEEHEFDDATDSLKPKKTSITVVGLEEKPKKLV